MCLLAGAERGTLANCSLPPGVITIPVAHHSVEELWHFLEGYRQVWRMLNGWEEVVDVMPGVCLTITVGTNLQFCNTGFGSLSFIILSMPPWSGPDEAYPVAGH